MLWLSTKAVFNKIKPRHRNEYLKFIKSVYDRRLGADSSSPTSFVKPRPHLYTADNSHDYITSYPPVPFEQKVFYKFVMMTNMKNLCFDQCIFDQIDFSDFAPDRLVIQGCKFSRCIVVNCTFSKADLRDVHFDNCRFLNCSFDMQTILQDVVFDRCGGMDELRGLGMVQIAEPQSEKLKIWPPIQSIPVAWTEVWFSWERLRTVGRLPLFGLSASALLGMPLITWGIALYNGQVFRLREWAETHAGSLDDASALAQAVTRIQPIPLPQMFFWTLIATLLLGVGSSLFTLFCPSRMKEFTSDRWIDELRQHPVRYLPFSWENRKLRIVTALCYSIGGFMAAVILGAKLYGTGLYIIRNTVYSWHGW